MLVKSQVKYIQSLGQKKLRDDEGVFLVEGPKIIRELLCAANTSLVQLFAVKSWLEEQDQDSLKSIRQLLVEIDERELSRISSLTTPNNAVAIFKKPEFGYLSPENTVSLLLDGISDPGNLGTIIRIADWFGIAQVFCSENCVDLYNQKAIQSTMGSISRVSVSYGDLESTIARYPDLPVYAAVLDGKNVFEQQPPDRGFIIIGNESKGITPAIRARVNYPITIPGSGGAESLNAAVAAGIVVAQLLGRKFKS